ncbi:RNA polymerase II subunit A C-terminal domain phosphatase [Saitoella coloradoensis]
MTSLSPAEQKSLLSALLHFETYREFTGLKIPGTVSSYGAPFTQTPSLPPQPPSPVIKLLCDRFLFTSTLPSIGSAPEQFWSELVEGVLEDMATQNLSDSYDKGVIGKRKILGMACVAFMETTSRGLIGKVSSDPQAPAQAVQGRNLSPEAAQHEQAWETYKQAMVHTNLVRDLLNALSLAPTNEHFTPTLLASETHVQLTCASILHYLLAHTGTETISLLDRLVGMVPWFLLRQTVKVANVSTMMSGLLKVLTGKGWLQSRNLMQKIIGTIFGRDLENVKRKTQALVDEGACGIMEQQNAIDRYVYNIPREEQVALREQSENTNTSIVAMICTAFGVPQPASGEEHANLLLYLACTLTARDRERLIEIFCEKDTLTHLIRDVFRIFEPVIRAGHRALNLADGLSDLERFLKDVVENAKSAGREDLRNWVKVVKDHEGSFLKFAHQLCVNAPEMREEYTRWYEHCLSAYRAPTASPAIDLASIIQPDEVDAVRAEINEWTAWQTALQSRSDQRLSQLLAGQAPDIGPGVWLATLKAMREEARVTPGPHPVDPEEGLVAGHEPAVPGMRVVKERLLDRFRDAVAKSGSVL